jgi:hypothetical protein
MPRIEKTDPLREDRIIMQIVVDAFGPDERAMGWYCYLENNLTFPFTARCTARRAISPLKPKDKVQVIGMADSDECLREMFITVRWDDDRVGGSAVAVAGRRWRRADARGGRGLALLGEAGIPVLILMMIKRRRLVDIA